MDLRKNDIIKLKITSMTAQGSGIGKTEEGIVVFVPNTVPGDFIEARVLKTKKTYAYGKIEGIITPSEGRIEPDCAVSEKCGGCVYRHIDYNSETEIKFNRVKDAMERIGGFRGIKINPVIKNDRIDRYRNKAQLPAGGTGSVELGFYAAHSHRIIPCRDCKLQPEFFGEITEVVKSFMNETGQTAYDEKTGKGKLRHLYIRYAESTGELMICFVVNGNGLKREDELIKRLREGFPNLKSVIFNSNKENTNVILGSKNRIAFGSPYITDVLCGMSFKLSPLSFYQVNRAQAEKLYTVAKEYAELSGDEVLLDLYCGTGTIGLTMANCCKTLIGVEIVPDAVEDAGENARLNSIENARFICADASSTAKALRSEGIKPDVVIIDPPRKGCEPELIGTIAEMEPERIVYVSCDPETLARDLRLFEDSNYSVEELTPVDLFSRTAHIETVARIRKDENR